MCSFSINKVNFSDHDMTLDFLLKKEKNITFWLNFFNYSFFPYQKIGTICVIGGRNAKIEVSSWHILGTEVVNVIVNHRPNQPNRHSLTRSKNWRKINNKIKQQFRFKGSSARRDLSEHNQVNTPRATGNQRTNFLNQLHTILRPKNHAVINNLIKEGYIQSM